MGGGDVRWPIEVGPDESCTVNEVAELVRNLVSKRLGAPPVEITHLPMRPGEKDSPDITESSLHSVLVASKAFLNVQEQRLLSRHLRSLGTTVRSDTTTLEQIGVLAADFRTLSEGLDQTIAWYQESEGAEWNTPKTENER